MAGCIMKRSGHAAARRCGRTRHNRNQIKVGEIQADRVVGASGKGGRAEARLVGFQRKQKTARFADETEGVEDNEGIVPQELEDGGRDAQTVTVGVISSGKPVRKFASGRRAR